MSFGRTPSLSPNTSPRYIFVYVGIFFFFVLLCAFVADRTSHANSQIIMKLLIKNSHRTGWVHGSWHTAKIHTNKRFIHNNNSSLIFINKGIEQKQNAHEVWCKKSVRTLISHAANSSFVLIILFCYKTNVALSDFRRCMQLLHASIYSFFNEFASDYGRLYRTINFKNCVDKTGNQRQSCSLFFEHKGNETMKYVQINSNV